MSRDAYITERDGSEVLLRTVPEGMHDAQTVAAEIASVAQRAYDLGRAAEGSALQRAIETAIRQTLNSAR